jgi:spoIIIJ-associated protein
MDETMEPAEGPRRRRRRGRRGRGGGGGDYEGTSRSESRSGTALASAPSGPVRENELEPARPVSRSRENESRRSSRAHAEEAPGMSGEALTELAERTTRDLLKAMGFEGKVTGKADGTSVEVTAEVSDDEELLTGRKGEVRQALQHLLTRMINRGEGSRYHLQLEINDFWHRREEDLAATAKELAEQAISSQSEVLTEYLNAQERRIIHVTLRDDSRVKTYAIGEGLIKKVAIAPADFPDDTRSED